MALKKHEIELQEKSGEIAQQIVCWLSDNGYGKPEIKKTVGDIPYSYISVTINGYNITIFVLFDFSQWRYEIIENRGVCIPCVCSFDDFLDRIKAYH